MDSKVIGNTNELCYVLDKLVVLHRNLLDVLREEIAHMSQVDLKGLGDTAQAKELLLSEIWNHEQLRLQSTEKLALSLQTKPEDATLLSIADKLPQQEGDKLRAARTALNMLVSEAKELNSQNMSFAESSLNRIEEMKKNALGISHNASKENYSNSGVRQPMPEQGGRLLSTEA